ncbi:MAG: SRPBCC family protein [Actinomycetota bacterium]|nr:SRPBCC family protein [Actinomycetota bacterium]
MSKVHVEIEIEAPAQRVWETVMDPHRLKDWVTIHRSLKHVSAHPLAKGSTMDQVLQIRGVSFRVHWTLIEVSAPHNAEWEGRGPARSHAGIRYELSGPESGPTAFRYTNEFGAPGGRLGSAASQMIVGNTSEREAHNSLQRLKALVERR